jgi:divalent metal cation (Fe/Co/Zn/Cd) transporter
LTAFGLDSLIELASAGILIWRLTVELRRGERFSEAAEKTASRIAGALLLALAAYVTVAAAWSSWTRAGEVFSWPGLVVAPIALPSMRYLAYRKIAVAEKLGSRALRSRSHGARTTLRIARPTGRGSSALVAALSREGLQIAYL